MNLEFFGTSDWRGTLLQCLPVLFMIQAYGSIVLTDLVLNTRPCQATFLMMKRFRWRAGAPPPRPVPMFGISSKQTLVDIQNKQCARIQSGLYYMMSKFLCF